MVGTKSRSYSNLDYLSKCGYSGLFLAPVPALVLTLSVPCFLTGQCTPRSQYAQGYSFTKPSLEVSRAEPFSFARTKGT